MSLLCQVFVSCLICHLCCVLVCLFMFFFFKQKTAYEMRISDWSSDVCSSDLRPLLPLVQRQVRSWYPQVRGRRASHRQQLEALGLRLSDDRGGHGSALHASARRLPPRGRQGYNVRVGRSDVRRVGTACVSPCRSRWVPYH